MPRRANDQRSEFQGLTTRQVERAVAMLENKGRRAFASLRIPETASKDQRDLAVLAGSRIVDVLMDKVHHQSAPNVLKAAFRIRDEICGPIAQKLEVEGSLEAIVRMTLPGDEAIDVSPSPKDAGADRSAPHELTEISDLGSVITQGSTLAEILSDD